MLRLALSRFYGAFARHFLRLRRSNIRTRSADCLLACSLLCSWTAAHAQKQPARLCQQLVLEGQAQQGFEWHASIGHPAGSGGNAAIWLIRLVPEGAGMLGGVIDMHSLSKGWDLAISPASNQDYPDALLLATPPYASINPREIATTYSLRAQDAITWSPRQFHFFTTAADLARARQLYQTLLDPKSDAMTRRLTSAQLLDFSTTAPALASGRMEILDAHLVSGTADPAPFAAQWASSITHIPHTFDPNAGKSSPRGELHSLRFRITISLPQGWKAPSGLQAVPAKCAE